MRSRSLLSLWVLALAVALAAALPAFATWTPAALYGGDVRSLAIAPADPDTLLAGTSAGQVFRSDDGGATWAPAASGFPLEGWVVSALKFDPNRPSRVWAALRGVFGDGRVVYSDDLGRHWVDRSAGLPGDQVYSLALVPGQEGKLFAGTLSGVYGSSDGGLSWRCLTASHPEIQKVSSLLVDPDDPSVVVAGTWRRAYRSRDGGATWHGVFAGMVLDSEVFSLSAVPGHAGELWASTCGWVYRAHGWGAHWRRFKRGLDERRTPSFAVLPDGRLLAGTVAGLYGSADGGSSWQLMSAKDLSIQAIGFDARRPRRIVLATEGAGVWRSTDGGSTFSPSNLGITDLRLSALLRHGDEILAAVRDAGPLSGIYRSRDGGLSFDPLPERLPAVLALALLGDREIAATDRGIYVDDGDAWQPLDGSPRVRFEQLSVGDGRLVARGVDGIYELADGHLQRVAYHHAASRSATLSDGALWVNDRMGLYRLTAAGNHSAALPYSGGRILSVDGSLMVAGQGGLWLRHGLAVPWRQVVKGETRALATGDADWPLVVLVDHDAELWSSVGSGRRVSKLDLPIPSRDVTAALVVGGRLLVGTSGYGLLSRPIAAPPPGPLPAVAISSASSGGN